MKPFDLKLALEGHEIIGEDGDRGKYVFSNKHHICGNKHFFQFSINLGKDQSVLYYDEDRADWFGVFKGIIHSGAIFMAPIKREVWTNVYRDIDGRFWTMVAQYRSEKEAREGFPNGLGGPYLGTYIKSIKIHEYEE